MLKDVVKFSFSPNDLRKELRSDDFWKYSIPTGDIGTLDQMMVQIADNIAKRNYCIDKMKMIPRRYGKHLSIIEDLENNLLIRRTNTILKQFVNQAIYDRNEEIKLLSSIIESEPNAIIFRTDISRFFESINFSYIIDKICAEGFNNYPSQKVLRSICHFTNSHSYAGLPRGLSISSTLANYFMKDFDKAVQSIPTCFYYTRYVDDILVALTSENINIKDSLIRLLPKGLALNLTKTKVHKTGQDEWLDYLGYSLNLNKGKPIKISKRKINKTKTRISVSIASFNKSFDFDLLLKRLSFLACNTRLRMSGRERPILVGFKFSYPLCCQEAVLEQMKMLDQFFHGLINSKTYKPSCRFRKMLNPVQLTKINSISFLHGFEKTIMTKLTRCEIAEVKQVWRYE